MAEAELERAEKKYAQAKARLQALKNRAATQERKLDTRRKVILGGALVDLAARNEGAAAMLDRLVRNLPREQDRKAFEGWSPGDGDSRPQDQAPDGTLGRTPDSEAAHAAGEVINGTAGPDPAATAGTAGTAAELPSPARLANRARHP